MKKILSVFIIITMCISLFGCGNNAATSETPATETPTAETTITETATTETAKTETETVEIAAAETAAAEAEAEAKAAEEAAEKAAAEKAEAEKVAAEKAAAEKAAAEKAEAEKAAAEKTATESNDGLKLGGERSIDGFVKALKANGFRLSKVGKMSDMMGSVDGYKYNVNGIGIEIYKFDLNSKLPISVKNIKSIQESGKMILPLQTGDTEIQAKINNDLVIAGYENHKDKDKILEIFNSLE
ncbi:hypothetical protein [Lutispora saccharofermentans]|uniref:Uncharacterized protein n=1 Tax=Lutispora saccharofermentans TaxID=3024236 RepID=A0ABT1NIR0_9FIRM|nr:hypothetical protein [Lutispora saccharofermentans]MCQ1530464.1 hypothetical protein [Lutispora saccharofermentans]